MVPTSTERIPARRTCQRSPAGGEFRSVIRRHAQLPTLLTVVADVITTTTALFVAYGLRFSSGLFPLSRTWFPERYLEALPPAILLTIATYSFVGNYRRPGVPKTGDPGLREATGGVLAAALLLLSGALLYRGEYQFSRGLLLLFPLVGIPLVWTGRVAAGAGGGLCLGVYHHRARSLQATVRSL